MDKQVIILREFSTTAKWHTPLCNYLHNNDVKCMMLDITTPDVISWFQQNLIITKNMVLVMSINTLLEMVEYFDYSKVIAPQAVFAVVDAKPNEIRYNNLIGDYYLYAFTSSLDSISSLGWNDDLDPKYYTHHYVQPILVDINSDKFNNSVLDTLKDLSITFDGVAKVLSPAAAKYLIDIAETLEIPRRDIISTNIDNAFILNNVRGEDIGGPYTNELDVSNPYWRAKILYEKDRSILILYNENKPFDYEQLEYL